MKNIAARLDDEETSLSNSTKYVFLKSNFTPLNNLVLIDFK